MKYIYDFARLIFAVVFFASCEKDKLETSPLASLNVSNAIVGGTTVRLGSNATNISNNNYAQLGLIAGDNDLYIWPVGDSANPYFTTPKFNAEERAVYSLFLTGTSATPEGFFVKEDIPYRTDSVAGIRFINLAPNTTGKALNITLSTSSAANDVSNLTYKQYTEFKDYPGLYNSSYTFQIRNDTCAAPKNPLATFSLASSAVPRFANITLVIRQNGPNGVSVFRVNNDR